jgi:hypothetical protein
MVKQFVIMVMVLFAVVLLCAEIGTATALPGLNNPVQFGGRQAVYANGDTLAFCYVQYTDLLPTGTGSLFYKYSSDGGQTFQTTSLGVSNAFDGAPTLFKEGSTVIVTFSHAGSIKRRMSYDDGATFTIDDSVPGSDRLPITDKYNGEYHSLYTYQDFTPQFYYNETPFSTSCWSFINNDQSTNETPVYYWGPDVMPGILRTNSDLWIRQAGGGTNNGWPTFQLPVILSGAVQSYSGTPPYAQVFQGGYYEHIPELPLGFTTIPAYALLVGPSIYDPNRIIMVTVNGASYTTMIGQIQVNGLDTLWVYANYPPGSGMPLYANYVPHVDTLWTPGPSGVSAGNTMMVNSPLWIQGTFSGTQVWYSPCNVFLIDDITLTNTAVGEAPDAVNNNAFSNETDKVAIVSGKSIYIQYGYKDPNSGLRLHPNCDGDAQGIWVYASLYALGDGGGNSHEDGVFTFEYQHPHPSIPAVTLSTPTPTLYDQIDLHRRPYPQTGANPWPGSIDLPYYNPLWPEGNPYMERGTVHVFGSIVQRRRGFMHRSLLDTEYPNPASVWDTEIDFCGGPSGTAIVDPVLSTAFQGVNAPNTTGSGVGYKKDFHFDKRIKSDTFGFNLWDFGIRLISAPEVGQWQTEMTAPFSSDVVARTYDRKFGRTLFSINNRLFQYHNNALTELAVNSGAEGNIAQLNLLDSQHALVYSYDKNYGLADQNYTPDTLHVCLLNLNDGTCAAVADGLAPSEMNDIAVLPNGLQLLARTNGASEVQFSAVTPDGQLVQLYTWNPNQPALSTNAYEFSKAKLTLIPSGADSLYALIWLPWKITQFPWSPEQSNGIMFMARGALANTAIEDDSQTIIPDLLPTVSSNPNPFRTDTTLKVNLPENSSLSMKIYNVRGELVKSFKQEDKSAGIHNLIWDGKNNQGNEIASGVYYYVCATDRHNLTGKLVFIK